MSSRPHVTVALDQFGDKVFVGRPKGERARVIAKLDRADERDSNVTVIVPEGVYSVNSSFFLGMFGPSVRRWREEGFRERYKFVGTDISHAVEDGIREALDSTSPLARAISE